MSAAQEKVFTSGIRKKPGYMYFLDNDLNVCCAPIHPKQVKKPKKRLVVETGLVRDPGFLYIVDKDGDIARIPVKEE